MIKSSLALIFSLALVQYVSCVQDKLNCSKAHVHEVLDDLGAAQGQTVLNPKYKLPTNNDEFSKRCTEMQDAIKQLRRYNKDCYSSLTQQVLSAIIRSRQNFIEQHCKATGKDLEAILGASKCVLENALEDVKKAERLTIDGSELILKNKIADNELRRRYACCAVIRGKKIFLDATRTKCGAYEKLFGDYVDSYTSEAFGLTCAAQEKLACDKLPALSPSATDSSLLPANFFLNPMVKLVETLDS